MDLQALHPTSFHISYVVAGLVTLLLFLRSLYRYSTPPQNTQEPPHIRSKIPIFGHLISLAKEGQGYLERLNHIHHHSVFTLPILGGRQYIVCTPDWLSVIHRNSKTISFNDLVTQVMEKVFLQDENTMSIMRQNANGEHGHQTGLLIEQHNMIANVLGHGQDLDRTTETVLNEEALLLNQLAHDGSTASLKLWDWIQQNISLASMKAIYGPENPYALDKTLLDDFWQLDKDMISLMMYPLPSITVKKGYRARKRLFDAWIEYFEKGRHKQAAEWIQRRAEINMDKYGISVRNYATSEISMNIAILSNALPTAFWLLTHILSSPTLHSSIRSELDTAYIRISSFKKKISFPALKSQTTTLYSTFRETLRHTAYLNSARTITSPTSITNPTTNETYLLRKNSMLQIATNLIHFNKDIYGPDADSFNPRRFLHMQGTTDPAAPFRDDQGKVHGGALRSFGSGNAICLGRHFATSEILGLVAVVVAGFEVSDERGGEGYTAPPVPTCRAAGGGIPRPESDPEVYVRRRKGYENVEWEFEL